MVYSLTVMTIIFLALSRKEGLTWGVCTPPEEPLEWKAGSLAEFCADAARCEAFVSQGVVAKVEAMRRAAGPAMLRALDGALIDVADAPTCQAARARYLEIKNSPLGAAPPSGEQWAVIAGFEQGKNVLCRAVAGAGKTTALLLVAGRAPATRFLALTYNKRLQVDMARRAPPNVTVLTYHAAAGRAYGGLVRTDEQLRDHVARGPPGAPPRFDVILIDEAQDMLVEYYVFVRHLLAANPGARMIVVGDELQSINEYRGAHPGFLTEAPALYRADTGREWVSCRLAVSHRLTPATANFVNTHLYGAPVITGGNHRDANRRPVYIAAAGKLAVTEALALAVKSAVVEYGPEGVYILAPSVRELASKQSPVAELVRCHLAGVPVFVAGDDARVDEGLTRGKLAILSFNAVKGCERPCVIVVGLDETYFRYYNKEWSDPGVRLPNILTVAATRASSRLVIIASAKATLRSVVLPRLGADAAVGGSPAQPRRSPGRSPGRTPKSRKSSTGIPRFVRHLAPEVVRGAMALVVSTRVAEAEAAGARGLIRSLGRVKFGGGTEEDLLFAYELLAPVLAEVARHGTSAFGAGLGSPEIVATADEVKPFGNQITQADHATYPPQFWSLVDSAGARASADRSFAEWAVLAVAHRAVQDGRHHIARQVEHYEWVDDGALIAARDAVLGALAGRHGAFAARAQGTVGLKTILGVADFVESPTAEDPAGTVWAFKLAELTEEHELQLACYLALRGGGEGRLVSILCRETRAVFVDGDNAAPLLALLAGRALSAAAPDVETLIAGFDYAVEAGGGLDGGDPEAWGGLDDCR